MIRIWIMFYAFENSFSFAGEYSYLRGISNAETIIIPLTLDRDEMIIANSYPMCVHDIIIFLIFLVILQSYTYPM